MAPPPPPPRDDDQEPPSVEQLLTEHLEMLRRVARYLVRPDEVDDVMQEACVVALSRPPRHHGNIKGYFTTILRSVVRKKRDKDARRIEILREKQPHQIAAEHSTENPVEQTAFVRDSAKRIQLALDSLPDLDRDIFDYSFYGKMSQAQIAEAVGLTAKAVEHRKKRIRERLQRRLESDGGAPWQLSCLALIDPDRFAGLLRAAPAGSGASATPAAAVPSLGKLALPLLAAASVLVPTLWHRESSPPTVLAPTARLAALWASGPGRSGADQEIVLRTASAPAVSAADELEARVPRRFQVLDAQEQPLAGAWVTVSTQLAGAHHLSRYVGLDGSRRDDFVWARSDEDGWVALLVPPQAEHDLVALHPDYGLVQQRWAAAPQAATGELRLTGKALPVRLRVERAASSEPVAHARIRIWREAREALVFDPYLELETQADGTVDGPALPPGAWFAHLSGPGVPARGQIVEHDGHDWILRAVATKEISFLVQTPDGEPIADAQLWAGSMAELQIGNFGRFRRPLGLPQRTDARGLAILNTLAADGSGQAVLVRAAGFEDRLVEIPVGARELPVRLEPSKRTIQVRVFDRQGRPAPSAQVIAFHASGPQLHARVDESGRTELAIPRPGRHAWTFLAYSPDGLSTATEVVPENEPEIRLDLQAAAPVTHRVTRGGRPAAGEAISLEVRCPEWARAVQMELETGPDGTARVQLPAGSVEYLARNREDEFLRSGPARLDVDGARSTLVEFTLEPVVRRSLRLLDDAGQPLADTIIYLAAEESRTLVTGGRTDRQGRFPFSGLAGRHFVWVSLDLSGNPGLTPVATSSAFLIAPGEEDLVVPAPPLASLEVRLELPEGFGPVAQLALVGAAGHQGSLPPGFQMNPGQGSSAVESDGVFRFAGIPPGPYHLVIPGADLRPPIKKRIEIGLGQPAELWKVSVASVRGTLARAAHLPQPVQLRLVPRMTDPAGRELGAGQFALDSRILPVDPGGAFSLPALPEGDWRLVLESAGAVLADSRASFSVRAGGSPELRLDQLEWSLAAQCAIQLAGTPGEEPQIDAALRPEPGSFALLHLETQRWFDLVADASGRAARGDLPSGAYGLYLNGTYQREIYLAAGPNPLIDL